jgi:hypothetical protein
MKQLGYNLIEINKPVKERCHDMERQNMAVNTSEELITILSRQEC